MSKMVNREHIGVKDFLPLYGENSRLEELLNSGVEIMEISTMHSTVYLLKGSVKGKEGYKYACEIASGRMSIMEDSDISKKLPSDDYVSVQVSWTRVIYREK